MEVARIDQVLKVAMLFASREDADRRQLGPIHLVKYVYLADMAYASLHAGSTYTSAPWRFYHFGPWTEAVFERIDQVAGRIGAEKRMYPSTRYERDAIRYAIAESRELADEENRVPQVICSALRGAIRDFGADTTALLHHVYSTAPMRVAAPNELLDFTVVVKERSIHEDVGLTAAVAPPLSKTQTKRAAETRARLRNAIRERLAARAAQRQSTAVTPPRYDDVFFDGQSWIDALAGPSPREVADEATFSNDIWKSDARREPGIP